MSAIITAFKILSFLVKPLLHAFYKLRDWDEIRLGLPS
jgi:hypothetical protein